MLTFTAPVTVMRDRGEVRKGSPPALRTLTTSRVEVPNQEEQRTPTSVFATLLYSGGSSHWATKSELSRVSSVAMGGTRNFWSGMLVAMAE